MVFFLKAEKLSSPVGFIKGKMNRFYQLLLYFHILVVLLQNVWLNIVFYDAVADYGRKYMEYGIENGTVGKAWAW